MLSLNRFDGLLVIGYIVEMYVTKRPSRASCAPEIIESIMNLRIRHPTNISIRKAVSGFIPSFCPNQGGIVEVASNPLQKPQ
jgi:hypothetical protein